jgi:hypothetical protein
MSSTELTTITLPEPVAATSASDRHEGATPPRQDVESDPSNSRRREQQLAPVDGGSAAWKLLFAAFMFETLLWGKVPSTRTQLNGKC